MIDLRPGAYLLEIPRHVVDSTHEFLRERGELGVEAVVLWFGVIDSALKARVARAFVPDQTALRTDEGVGVYVSGEAITRLILALGDGETVLARVHSHPSTAYHSHTDDLNRLISHAGAISIVVPRFARNEFRLETCSTNELVPDRGWQELHLDDVRRRFVIL